MEREIRIYPDEVLKKEAQRVEDFNSELRELVGDMFDTMYKKGGVGLAANQVGVLKRVFIVDLNSGKEGQGKEKLVFINPEIIHSEGKDVAQEGCLSLPGLWKKVKRAKRVVIKAQDLEGREFQMEAEGLLARALQHELDHLNGMVFIDRLSPLQRRLALEKYKKLKRKLKK
ncbi:peptide deformylase [Thermovibrio guaymasensis]|uniref:Peptide deformylase n=1 Tax=Thermovibrio guaymasensis TaxID=240167 RepID=A0A420W9B5_9BACT|nr:peptide deformylase [Thermovibrio guaymasensis]RKQ63910.1 peptide deformylase [Thermovibrio guaymasensis]